VISSQSGLRSEPQARKNAGANEIIEIKPTKKFGGAWCAYEPPGVSTCYPGPTGKQFTIDYARTAQLRDICLAAARIFGWSERPEVEVNVANQVGIVVTAEMRRQIIENRRAIQASRAEARMAQEDNNDN
jgi:hypothetical protein